LELWLLFAIILVLIFLSALLSASETSLTGSSKPRIHHLAKKGNAKATVVESLINRLESVISTILLGNTLLNILASTLMTGAMIKVFGTSGVLYATFLMVFIILLFAEVMPKLYAVRHPETSALFLSFFISKLIIILKPFTKLAEFLAYFSWKLLGVDLSVPEKKNYEDDLRGAIELHRGTENLTAEKTHMLKSILDLNDMTVNEILIHRKDIVSINIDQSTDAIVTRVLENPYTRYPIWEKNPENIIGILHARDLLNTLRNSYTTKKEPINLRPLISKPWYVPKSTSVFDQLQAFRQRREHFAFVIDEYGTLQGIITLEDILEEIVGEISDEHDPKNQIAHKQKDGSIVVKGHVTIRDLNRQMDWDLPVHHAITIAGLVIYTCRLIPKTGQEVSLYGFKIKVIERQRNQLTKLKIYAPKKEAS